MRKCPKCGRELDPPTRICPDDQTPLRDTVSQDEQPIGRTLDRKYRIDGFLKRGGMGAVYRGTHLLLNKGIAIKLIRPEIVTSDEMVTRFFREARAAAKLSHPNIVTVHDLGQTEDGTLYIIMELVDGRSLKELIQKEGPMNPERALALAKGVASALSLAHRNDIVHRDLKPQNIMVTLDADGVESPKLLDFGIAKTLEPDTPALTGTGMVLGTPHYMSSEQAKGKPADQRSDLYALGIILYEMLVGKVPFDDTSIPSILVKHLTEIPKPPSTLRAGIPPEVEALVLRCLEKEPENRFQSATELIKAIDSPPPPKDGATGPSVAPLPLEPTLAETRPTPPPPPPGPAGPPSQAAQPSEHTMAGAAAAASSSARFHSGSGTVRAHEVQGQPSSGNRAGLIALIAIVVFLLGGVGAAFFVVRTVLTRVTGEPEPERTPIVAATEPGSEAETDTETEAAPTAVESEPAPEPVPVPEPEPPTAAAAAPTPTSSRPPARPPRAAATTPQASPPSRAETTPPPAQRQTEPAPEPTPRPQPQPQPQPPPENATFNIECEGVRDACGAMRLVLRDALVKQGMSPARVGAEFLITLEVEEVEARSEQQFGTTFVIRTYSVSGGADVPRFDDLVDLPAHTFSFDARFGRDKLREQARIISADMASELKRYWSGKTR